MDESERSLLCEIIDAPASPETIAVAGDCLEERGFREAAARLRGGELLSVAVERLLAADRTEAFELLAPMLERGANATAFEHEREAAIVTRVEALLHGAGGPHTSAEVRARRAARVLDPRWLALLESRRRRTPPNVHAALEELVASAVPSSRGVPWCTIHEQSADRVVVHGAAYDENLLACTLVITYERTDDGWRWELRFDAVDDEGLSLDPRNTVYPDLLGESRWRATVVGETVLEAPVLPSLEPASTWERLFDLVDGEGAALALCWLVEQVDDLRVNGLSLDLHSVHEAGEGRLSERGIADLVARRLGDDYLTYYCSVRARDATDAELSLFVARCAASGLRLSHASGAPAF